jgi:hypothetical membrane protein
MNQARTSPVPPHSRGKRTARWLALAGVVGPLFFVGVVTFAGFLRPGYSPIHQAMSDLGVGQGAWLVDGSVIINGLLLVGFAGSFLLSLPSVLRQGWRWLIAALFALHGLGLALAGIFTEAPSTLSIHILAAFVAFYSPVVAFLVLGLVLLRPLQWRGWGISLLTASLATLVLVRLMGWVFTPGTPLAPMQLGGLMERIVLVEVEAWYVALGWRLFALAGSHEKVEEQETPGKTRETKGGAAR